MLWMLLGGAAVLQAAVGTGVMECHGATIGQVSDWDRYTRLQSAVDTSMAATTSAQWGQH